MFKKIKKSVVGYLEKLELKRVSEMLINFGCKIEDLDFQDRSILFAMGDIVVILNLDSSVLGNRMETSLNIDSSEVLSLKTMSDLANLAYVHTCAVSGLKPAENGSFRLSICMQMDRKITKNDLAISASYLTQCISKMDEYIMERFADLDQKTLDLSMFEEIDLFLFNPRDLGEKKQYIHKTWDSYLEYIESDKYNGFTETRVDLEACAVFEDKNKLLLSEVGDMVLKELIWNRRLSEAAEDSNLVN